MTGPQATAPAYYFGDASHYSSRETPPYAIPDGLREMNGYNKSVGYPGVERIVSSDSLFDIEKSTTKMMHTHRVGV